jgi:hypothetical protein
MLIVWCRQIESGYGRLKQFYPCSNAAFRCNTPITSVLISAHPDQGQEQQP